MHSPVSLCALFGAGTTLTISSESPTSPRSFLRHESVTFCQFLAIWVVFLGLGAGLGSAAGSGTDTKRGVAGCVLSLRLGGLWCASQRAGGGYFLN